MRTTNGLSKLYLFTIRSSLALWLDLGWCDCVQKQKGETMKFLMLGLEKPEKFFAKFIVNTSKIIVVAEDTLFGERCLKLLLDDGKERYCTHILTSNRGYARIGSIGQFYKDLISEDKHD